MIGNAATDARIPNHLPRIHVQYDACLIVVSFDVGQPLNFLVVDEESDLETKGSDQPHEHWCCPICKNGLLGEDACKLPQMVSFCGHVLGSVVPPFYPWQPMCPLLGL